MFFSLSKLLAVGLTPSNWVGFAALLGFAALFIRWPRTSHAFFILSGLIFVIGGWSPLGPSLLILLEERFPQPTLQEPVDGVILLGGSVDTHISQGRNSLTLSDAGERVVETGRLAVRFPTAAIFISGGPNTKKDGTGVSESSIARDILLGLGIPAGRITMEEISRNTCENAIESKRAINPQPGARWLLVTSATHMPRSVACFRKAGFDIIPYPVDYRTESWKEFRRPVRVASEGFTALDLAAHEWIGLISYRIFGLTDEFFPAP